MVSGGGTGIGLAWLLLGLTVALDGSDLDRFGAECRHICDVAVPAVEQHLADLRVGVDTCLGEQQLLLELGRTLLGGLACFCCCPESSQVVVVLCAHACS